MIDVYFFYIYKCWLDEAENNQNGQIAKETTTNEEEGHLTFKIPNIGPQAVQFRAKSPLKLVMNPKGQIWDLNALRHSGINLDAPPLSPEICTNLVKDLNTPKGKGSIHSPNNNFKFVT